ncbi:MAG: hypothetical protein J3Q66DRAFT_331712 [Benniella sp.]|nr:MAG: hypothetical protein J3Q66DRAFT_331712 [Benniella sp.]
MLFVALACFSVGCLNGNRWQGPRFSGPLLPTNNNNKMTIQSRRQILQRVALWVQDGIAIDIRNLSQFKGLAGTRLDHDQGASQLDQWQRVRSHRTSSPGTIEKISTQNFITLEQARLTSYSRRP